MRLPARDNVPTPPAAGEDGPVDGRVRSRAELPVDEARLGSDDAHRQAELILEDSDVRTATRIDRIPINAEQRTSEDTVPPVEDGAGA
jgi:hypothetical protein